MLQSCVHTSQKYTKGNVTIIFVYCSFLFWWTYIEATQSYTEVIRNSTRNLTFENEYYIDNNTNLQNDFTENIEGSGTTNVENETNETIYEEMTEEEESWSVTVDNNTTMDVDENDVGSGDQQANTEPEQEKEMEENIEIEKSNFKVRIGELSKVGIFTKNLGKTYTFRRQILLNIPIELKELGKPLEEVKTLMINTYSKLQQVADEWRKYLKSEKFETFEFNEHSFLCNYLKGLNTKTEEQRKFADICKWGAFVSFSNYLHLETEAVHETAIRRSENLERRLRALTQIYNKNVQVIPTQETHIITETAIPQVVTEVTEAENNTINVSEQNTQFSTIQQNIIHTNNDMEQNNDNITINSNGTNNENVTVDTNIQDELEGNISNNTVNTNNTLEVIPAKINTEENVTMIVNSTVRGIEENIKENNDSESNNDDENEEDEEVIPIPKPLTQNPPHIQAINTSSENTNETTNDETNDSTDSSTSDYEKFLEETNKQMKELEEKSADNRRQRSVRKTITRTKRGVVNEVGRFEKFLWGTAHEDDIRRLRQVLDGISDKQSSILMNLRMAAVILDDHNSYIKGVTNAVDKLTKIVGNVTSIMIEGVDKDMILTKTLNVNTYQQTASTIYI